MGVITVGTVRGTGQVTGQPAVGATITTGLFVSRISGLLVPAIATTRATAAGFLGVAVSAGSTPTTTTGTAGATIAIGNQLAIRKVGSTWKLYKKLGNEKSVGTATTAGRAGQTITYQIGTVATVNVATSGTIDLGTSLVYRTFYCLSATSGKICPIADLTTGMYFTLVGWGNADGDLVLNPVAFDNVS